MVDTVFPPRSPEPSLEQIKSNLRACLGIQKAAALQDKRPFAATLVGPDNKTILLSHFSISHVEHAESCLARLATIHYKSSYLWTCTLYCTWEPCAMCTGTVYWSNIGRLVYAASEEKLKMVTGEGNPENFTMSLPCRDVLKHGQKDIQVWGPIEDVENEVIEDSERFWKPVREMLGLDTKVN
ncbi:hypothetical protein BLS_009808 [Venturia inaequalis]|uniref:CMP/dCMP-type deaminase domain-containing protein n=2 Tax=Venturia inaequalis TaxID=5025 RepID=A0A8H3U4J6_VENIN|nr:hypothetical protein BLS_009808 [Venturia inaequalis]KAE9964505.1 hypothetical protein EG328_010413 [Venturia inaequalis]RDI83281.1 hypothetical protein Vi05172_g6660 [Venturia inaequalis]